MAHKEHQAASGLIPENEPELMREEIDWDGPDDPDNPHNWPKWQRLLHSAIPAVYAFALCIGISTLVAGIPLIQLQFDVSRQVALLPVSLYTVGFMIGPCIAGVFSEMYGRRWIYWTNFPMLVIFNAIAAASDNFTVLVVFRFLAGTFGSGVLAVGAATVSDLWSPSDVGRVGVGYILAPFLGPTLGPLTGAYVIHQYDNDWKWAIWVVLCILAPVGLFLAFMKETSKSRILQLRARQRGQTVEQLLLGAKVGKVAWAMLRPFHMCLFEPVSLLVGLYTGYSFAMVFSFFGSYALVYSSIYNFDPRQIGLCYIPVVIGFLFAVVTFAFFDARVYRPALERLDGKVAPEQRLHAALLGCFLVPIGLFWYAWAPRQGVHWIVPVLAGFPFGWGTFASFLACMAYLVDVYGVANTASAIAANGIIRFALGAAFPLFIIQLYQSDIGYNWVGSIFAFISVAMIPVPWIFFWKGRELRKRSHYPTNQN